MKRLLPLILAIMAPVIGAMAATPQQMEQARAAAYRLCLRYMNNGSGYLDDKSASSTAELEGIIASHDKEKSNLARLKSIPIPSEKEYASWDKGTFDKFWTVTFMDKTPQFDGKTECRGKVARKVSAIKVTVVEPAKPADPNADEAPAEEPQEEKAEEPEPGTNADAIVEAAPATTPASDSVLNAAEGPANTEKQSQNSGNTVSIIVLCILVLVVVALVAYALNVMRKSKEEQEPARPRATRRQQERPASAPVSEVDPEDESAFAGYAAPAPAQTPDARDAEIASLRAEVERLRRGAREPERDSRYTPGSAHHRQPRVIYLARANADGVFTRADASFNMGNSIFKLVTTDGVSGTYQVIDDPAVYDLALMMPTDYLENACTGRNLQLSQGAGSIINEAAGTAVFDQGRWRVTRKCRIRYSR